MENERKTYIVTEYGVRPNLPGLQTDAVQKVLDLCRPEGGTIVFPAGSYCVSSLWMWSDTTLLLESGAILLGSEDCSDYRIFPIPDGVQMRSDMEMIPQQYGYKPWAAYRRAMISSYGQRNLSIIGRPGSVIDGRNCYDPAGEEGYRGPHGIYLTNCENIVLTGYTAQHNGNFMHQLDRCENTVMRSVTCLGGSDGIHLHCCRHTVIEDCMFHTGDDCIAGINIQDLQVRRCELNTSCNLFRIGGVGIHVEDCRMFGPGEYPHRMTIVRGRQDVLPKEAGRHNMLCVIEYFASVTYPADEPAHDILFRNCTIENAERFLHYHADDVRRLHAGTHLTGITLDHVVFTGLASASSVRASAEEPLHVTLRGVSVSFRPDAPDRTLFDGQDPNTFVVTEA